MGHNHLVKLMENTTPVNNTTRCVIQPTHPDNYSPEQVAQEHHEQCKQMAKDMRADFPEATGRHAYLLNLAARKLGYGSYYALLDKCGKTVQNERTVNRVTAFKKIQELQLKIAVLEEEMRL